MSTNFQTNVESKQYHTENSKTGGANSVDPDEVAQIEPPHLDLRCSANVTIFISGTFRCMNTPP